MNYKDIIKANLQLAIQKRDNAKSNRQYKYWNYIAHELVRDYNTYVNEIRWSRTRFAIPDIDDLIRRFFGDLLW